jgi:hypothetical protein
MRVLTQAAERSEPYDSMPAPKDPAAHASMLVLARTTVHATSHGGGILVSILHLLPYLQAVLTERSAVVKMPDSGEVGSQRNDAVNRTVPFRSETETETAGSVENPGYRAPNQNQYTVR